MTESEPYFAKVRRIGGSVVIPVTKTGMAENETYVARCRKTKSGFVIELERLD